ncbi:MAG: ribonuclease PH [Acidobacteriota bacterium]
MISRANARGPADLRRASITPGFVKNAHGSVLMELGDTRVICTACREDRVPPFLRNSGKGWITAEYGMIPGSTSTRTARESSLGRQSGRSHEIQRLIGRALRSIVDLHAMGEQTIWIDCDVIQADGSTRCAAITGSFVAMALAMKRMTFQNHLKAVPIKDFVAAASVGIIAGDPLLDLDYQEDSMAEVDMNVVQTGRGKFVELQGTAEGRPFDGSELQALIELAEKGIKELIGLQRTIFPDLSV